MDRKNFNEEEFFARLEKILSAMEEKISEKPQFVNTEIAMKMLNISSKTTLQKFRDEGKIKFRKVLSKNILYDRKSIDDFLNGNGDNNTQPS